LFVYVVCNPLTRVYFYAKGLDVIPTFCDLNRYMTYLRKSAKPSYNIFIFLCVALMSLFLFIAQSLFYSLPTEAQTCNPVISYVPLPNECPIDPISSMSLSTSSSSSSVISSTSSTNSSTPIPIPISPINSPVTIKEEKSTAAPINNSPTSQQNTSTQTPTQTVKSNNNFTYNKVNNVVNSATTKVVLVDPNTNNTQKIEDSNENINKSQELNTSSISNSQSNSSTESSTNSSTNSQNSDNQTAQAATQTLNPTSNLKKQDDGFINFSNVNILLTTLACFILLTVIYLISRDRRKWNMYLPALPNISKTTKPLKAQESASLLSTISHKQLTFSVAYNILLMATLPILKNKNIAFPFQLSGIIPQSAIINSANMKFY
jgi:hypothetical protein